MPYETKWLIEDEIIIARFWGASTEDELRQALTEVADMRMNSPRGKVHSISDSSKVTHVLPFQDSMRVAKEFQQYRDDGWDIIVGRLDGVMKLSIALSRSILRLKSINVQTINEAIEHLKKEDPELSWHKMNEATLQ